MDRFLLNNDSDNPGVLDHQYVIFCSFQMSLLWVSTQLRIPFLQLQGVVPEVPAPQSDHPPSDPTEPFTFTCVSRHLLP